VPHSASGCDSKIRPPCRSVTRQHFQIEKWQNILKVYPTTADSNSGRVPTPNYCKEETTMSIAISATPHIQQTAVAQTKSSESVEGTQPDGDGDQDDQTRVAEAQKSNSSATNNSTLGSQLDLLA